MMLKTCYLLKEASLAEAECKKLNEIPMISFSISFWDTKIHINTDRIELEQQEEATKRYVSPNQHRHKKGQDMKDIVEYQHAPVFRDEVEYLLLRKYSYQILIGNHTKS